MITWEKFLRNLENLWMRKLFHENMKILIRSRMTQKMTHTFKLIFVTGLTSSWDYCVWFWFISYWHSNLYFCGEDDRERKTCIKSFDWIKWKRNLILSSFLSVQQMENNQTLQSERRSREREQERERKSWLEASFRCAGKNFPLFSHSLLTVFWYSRVWRGLTFVEWFVFNESQEGIKTEKGRERDR